DDGDDEDPPQTDEGGDGDEGDGDDEDDDPPRTDEGGDEDDPPRTDEGGDGDGDGDGDTGDGDGDQPDPACFSIHATCVAEAETLQDIEACEALFDNCIDPGPCESDE